MLKDYTLVCPTACMDDDDGDRALLILIGAIAGVVGASLLFDFNLFIAAVGGIVGGVILAWLTEEL